MKIPSKKDAVREHNPLVVAQVDLRPREHSVAMANITVPCSRSERAHKTASRTVSGADMCARKMKKLGHLPLCPLSLVLPLYSAASRALCGEDSAYSVPYVDFGLRTKAIRKSLLAC